MQARARWERSPAGAAEGKSQKAETTVQLARRAAPPAAASKRHPIAAPRRLIDGLNDGNVAQAFLAGSKWLFVFHYRTQPESPTALVVG